MVDLQGNTVMAIVYFTATLCLVLLACVFLVSGVSKLFARQQFVFTLQQLGLVPHSFIRPLSFLVPILEIGVAIIVFWGNARAGILSGLLLLAIFVSVTIIAIRRGRTNVECSCFGPLSRQAFGPEIVVQNIALALLGIFALAIYSLPSGAWVPVMSSYLALPVLFPALAIFPIYALSRYFLTNRSYYHRHLIVVPEVDPINIAAPNVEHTKTVVEGAQL